MEAAGNGLLFQHILWIFSSFSVRNCQPDFYLAVTGSCKTSCLVFLDQLKVSLNVCLFLGFPSVGIKSDDGYQIGRRISSDNHRPILHHVISYIYVYIYIYIYNIDRIVRAL